MTQAECLHVWEMVNVANGLVVMKKCFHCARVSTCFTYHGNPPLASSHEGEHFWNVLESQPSFHFDLKCAKCGALVKLDKLVGLMVCTGCDETCEVDVLKRKLEPEHARPCVVLGPRPIDLRRQLAREKISILQDYFNQQCESLGCRIELVSHELVKNIGKCYAELIKDAQTLFTVFSQDN